MFLPYGTDAPIYHYPFATIGIITANAALFLVTGMGGCGDFDWLILEYNRINPLQWVTGAFMHASWCHLIGNMIFLWCFGLIVEGKLGWYRYCLLYLCLALGDGAIGQIPMFLFTDGQGGALGASGVIFALMAVCLIWAPENDIHFLFTWGWFFVGTVEIPIWVVALFYFSIEFLQIAILGISMSTPMLHLLGMSVGIPFAIGMLKLGWVDCEGWDLFSRVGITTFSGSQTRDRDEPAPAIDVSHPRRAASLAVQVPKIDHSSRRLKRDPCATSVELFGQAVQSIRLEDAVACFARLRENSWIPAVPESTLVKYAKLLAKAKRYKDCIVPLRHLCLRGSRHSNSARLRIAEIELRHNHDPQSAVEVLREMTMPMNDAMAIQRKKILRVAGTRIRAQAGPG